MRTGECNGAGGGNTPSGSDSRENDQPGESSGRNDADRGITMPTRRFECEIGLSAELNLGHEGKHTGSRLLEAGTLSLYLEFSECDGPADAPGDIRIEHHENGLAVVFPPNETHRGEIRVGLSVTPASTSSPEKPPHDDQPPDSAEH